MNFEIKINHFGDRYYYLNKVLHREDGPAKEYANGSKEWYKNGKLHRENGPAKEYIDGYKAWYKDGKRHRENGPAIEHPNRLYKEWRLNDKLYGFNNKFTNESWKSFVKTLIFS